MKRHFPGRFELLLFMGMALVSVMVVGLSPHRDTALFICTGPIFLISALLGFRRSQTVGQGPELVDEDEPLI